MTIKKVDEMIHKKTNSCPVCQFNIPFKKEELVPVYKTESSINPCGYTFLDLSKYQNLLPDDVNARANIRVILNSKE